MKAVFAPVAAALFFAASTVAQLTVNTPSSPVVCQPLLITWSGGTPPYFLSILPGNQPGAAALISFPQQTATSLTWIVNITAGTSLGLDLRDNTGTLVQSAPFTTQAGVSNSCLTSSGGSSSTGGTASSGSTPGTGSTSSSAPATTPTTPATTPVTTPATTPATTPLTTPGTSPAGSTNSAPATTSSPPKAAAAVSSQTLNIGLLTAVGAALVAFVMA